MTIGMRHLFFPALMAAPIGAMAALTVSGMGVEIAAPVVVVVHLVVLALVERVWPRVESVDLFADPQAPRDAAHGILNSIVGSPLGAVAATALLAVVFGGGDGPFASWWPTGIPFAGQVVAAWLVYGFCDYWKHRAYHSIDLLWWLHAVHHDVDAMHVLKGARLHPLEATVRAGLVAVPLLVLGVPGEVLVWGVTLDSFLGNLNHSNLDQRFPRFVHWLVPTIDLHHIHHAVDRGLHDANLGIPIFDLVFGTYTDPRRVPRPVVGIANSPVPATLGGQLTFPLRQWRDALRPSSNVPVG